ncbi:MAG: bifunctional phosphopantothenoylcysteine decarboxylase/phosphopantothenate--cysteine ligase CoaBC [Thermoplasmata archaeon]|nr:bifunctional phosphopantothenoylcysteine decarboxylase/phosphopantothenate--cysteine ligase CoaBC [Thermoplasmata archaeon]
MHPSRAIRGRRSELLAGRRVIIGISGSIAAVEVPRIARELIRHGAEVRAVMSSEATRIITPEAIQFATGHPPVLQLSGDVEHVQLLGPGEGRADLLLIAPATANTLSKIAHGIDDTPVTTFASVALGGGVPVLIAPAMHADMGRNPAVRENLERLAKWGVGVIASQSAEGEEKLASPEEVAAAVLHRIARGPWAGRRVVVIGGASRESIDDVRTITNESSGETAVALATQAFYRGAAVEFWVGSLKVPVPPFLPHVAWRGVGDLLELARRHRETLARADAVFVPAALSDFTLLARPGKIRSSGIKRLELALNAAPKLLPELRRLAPRPCRLVGFKLESGNDAPALEAAARELLVSSQLDWVVANDARVLGTPETTVLVLSRNGSVHRLAGPKMEVAGKLLDDIGRAVADESSARRPPAPAGRRSRGGVATRSADSSPSR